MLSRATWHQKARPKWSHPQASWVSTTGQHSASTTTRMAGTRIETRRGWTCPYTCSLQPRARQIKTRKATNDLSRTNRAFINVRIESHNRWERRCARTKQERMEQKNCRLSLIGDQSINRPVQKGSKIDRYMTFGCRPESARLQTVKTEVDQRHEDFKKKKLQTES